MALGFEFDPRHQCLFNYPAFGAIKTFCKLVVQAQRDAKAAG